MKHLLPFLLIIMAIHSQAQNEPVLMQPKPPPVEIIKSNIPPQQTLRANAGPAQTITLPNNSVTLIGSVTPRDVVITSQWSQVSGPGNTKISSPKSQETEIGFSRPGTYQFVFTVRDNRKQTASDTVTVTVYQEVKNQPPIANAGPNVTITLPTSFVNLKGDAKDPDPKGSITSSQWKQIGGNTRSTIVSPNELVTQVTGLVEAGKYEFELTVTDNSKATGSDRVIVTVEQKSPPSNKPPIANAGPDQKITLSNSGIRLIGDGTDPEGSKLNFFWTQISGPSQSFIVSPKQAETLIYKLDKTGDYVYEFVVTDNNGSTASDLVTVSVMKKPPPPNSPPIADAGADQTITLPQNSVILNGRGSDPDSVGDIIKNHWSQISGPPNSNIVARNQSITKITDLEEGVYLFEFTVTDNQEATSSDIVKVTVSAEDVPPPDTTNRLPTANAGDDQTIRLPESKVNLTGIGTDPDGTIIKYQWTQSSSNPSQAVIIAPNQASTEIDSLIEGNYLFEFIVTDNNEATSKDMVMITVNPIQEGENPWPIIIGLGIITLLSASYFIFWIPGPKKVIAFYMHPNEKELINTLMPDGIKTNSYSVGRCNRSNIRKMKKKRIAIHILNTTNLVINTPGNTRSFQFDYKKGVPQLKSEKTEAKPDDQIKNLISEQLPKTAQEFPAFFMITLDEPMLPGYEKRLDEIGVHVIEHIPNNSYSIFVTDSEQLSQLREPAFDFIRLIHPYTARDTGLIVREDHFLAAVQSDDSLILDLVLHREEDRPSVNHFLKELGIESIGSDRNRIRIKVPARSVLDYHLPANTYIQAIYEYIPMDWHNDVVRQLVGIDATIHGKNLVSETGDGEIIGVADSGIDRDHTDLKANIIDAVAWGRKLTNDTSDPSGHGTHVTGSIVGDGTASDGKIKGMAPGAKVFFQSLLDEAGSLGDIDLQLKKIFEQAYSNGARIHNNSWGSATEARYTIKSNIVDEFIFEHPELLIVMSAGNYGISKAMAGPGKGYVGFGSVGSPATNKNGLTVGASRNKRRTGGFAALTYGDRWPEKFPAPPTSMEMISGDPDSIAAFSSRGRCDDHRMKPDMVAPGTDILSTKSSLAGSNQFHGAYAKHDGAYAYLGGTSMAAPMVSGAAALVREYYKKKRDYPAPSAALIKATLINGTRKLKSQSAIHGGDMIPNPNQGYGMLDLSMTIPNDQQIFKLEFRDSLHDPSLILNESGDSYTLQLHVQNLTWIRACLTYTDHPARSIQNDLDLLIDYEPTRQKWSGNLGINAQDPFRSREEDSTNNLEIIRIDEAKPGIYSIMVVAYNLPKGAQGFALVVTTGDLSASII